MKTHRTTYTLLAFFFASLLILWALEHFGVRTAKERLLRDSLVLPELLETPEIDVRKISVERGKERLVFERRGAGSLRWQMIEPVNAAAEAAWLETLVRNLKELRRSVDAGSLTGQPATFGLDEPQAVVRLWGRESEGATHREPPLATLDVGKVVGRLRYIRPGEQGAIEVADAKILNVLERPVAEWRERKLLDVSTFEVASVAIKKGSRAIRAERGRNGRFRLVEPLVVPADGQKVEGLLATLSSLSVTDGGKGFVADDAKDLRPFGLAPPEVTIELTTIKDKDQPLVLDIGKVVPGQSDRVYARQGDQNDVVTISAAPLAELPRSSVALRSKKVAELEPLAVSEVRIKSPVQTFLLKKESNEWMQKEPQAERADGLTVAAFLKRIAALETSEFLDPARLRDTQLSPPLASIELRETRLGRSGATSATDQLVLDLRIGRLDAARKVLFVQLANDEVVLAIPDNFLEVFPKNAMAFRDRSIAGPGPADVRKLTITRAGRTDLLVPAQGGQPNRWRMVQPINAPADTRAVTQVLATLANLRATDFVADSLKDAAKFGLDKPILEVTWETEGLHRLKVGAQVPKTASYYASIEDQPPVFILKAEALKPFESEFRDHLVMSFPPASVRRLLLDWNRPKRAVVLLHRQPTAKGQLDWVPEPASGAAGLDISAVSALGKALSHLETVRYLQYGGEIPTFTGLLRPRFTATVKFDDNTPDRVLRIGHDTGSGLIFAAEGTTDSGPVFLLPAASWASLIQSGEQFPPLPKDLFAPAR